MIYDVVKLDEEDMALMLLNSYLNPMKPGYTNVGERNVGGDHEGLIMLQSEEENKLWEITRCV